MKKLTTVTRFDWFGLSPLVVLALSLLIGPGTCHAIVDEDENGLSDVWQAVYQLGPIHPGDDLDGDGQTNAEEEAAGTDPLDVASHLHIEEVVHDSFSDLIQAHWPSEACKFYQFQATPDLDVVWTNIGSVLTGAGGDMMQSFSRSSLPIPSGVPQQWRSFVRLHVFDQDMDGDGVTAWEEKIVGTEDNDPNTGGGPGGDYAAATNWVNGSQPQQFDLREVALAHVGGRVPGPPNATMVTASGSGAWIRMTSWVMNVILVTLNPPQYGVRADFLQDSTTLDGSHPQLLALKPEADPDAAINPFLLGRITQSFDLILKCFEIDPVSGEFFPGTAATYVTESSVGVRRYAMDCIPHQGRPGFLVVTPMVAENLGGSRHLRIATWTADPASGGLVQLSDTSNLAPASSQTAGFRHVDIEHLQDSLFVVTFGNADADLSTLFVSINDDGIVTDRGLSLTNLNIRGVTNIVVPVVQAEMAAFTPHGYVTAVLDGNNNMALKVWEERTLGCDTGCVSLPFLITDQNADTQPAIAGVQLRDPVLNDSGERELYNELEDFFGSVLAAGDFNGDGNGDLAVGVPDSAVNLTHAYQAAVGEVDIYYGTATGYSIIGQDQTLKQGVEGLTEVGGEGDRFGHALAVGDFNNDGYDDLAVGVPGETISSPFVPNAGAVHVIYGSTNGLTAAGNHILSQETFEMAGESETGEMFGAALASGDFNFDGYDDLAIGIPKQTVGTVSEAGAVHIVYGSSIGLLPSSIFGNLLFSQDDEQLPDSAEEEDRFGSVLVAGNFDLDPAEDLVIGIPEEDLGEVTDSGAAQVVYGLSGIGLILGNNAFFSQAGFGATLEPVLDQPEFFDAFGSSLATGDFDGDGFDELAVGVPLETLEGIENISFAGAVHVFWGTTDGLLAFGNQFITQDGFTGGGDILQQPESGDRFGDALAVGDFNRDSFDDLCITAPGEDVLANSVTNAGGFHVLYGAAISPKGLGTNFNRFHFQGSANWMAQAAELGDAFGKAVVAVDVDDDGRHDLVVGAPSEHLSLAGGTFLDDTNGGVAVLVYGPIVAANQSGGRSQTIRQRLEAEVRARLVDATYADPSGSGSVLLYEQHPSTGPQLVHNASVTKNMTLLLAVEAIEASDRFIDLDDMVEISVLVAATGGSIMEPALNFAEQMPLELLLHGMMLRSGNKCSVAIAEHVALSGTNFVIAMNDRAAALGMTNTVYGHPAGGCVSSMEDQLKLWNFAVQYPLFRQIASATNYQGCGLNAVGGDKCYDLVKLEINSLTYPGLGGWKGGNGFLWWFNNGENWPDSVAFACSAALVSESSRLNRELHLCLQQTGDRWGDHDRLMDYGYQKLFTPDFRSVLNVPLAPMSDFDLVTVSDQMALFAYVEGTGVSIRGRGFSPVTVVALGQTNSILDLPAASSLAGPRREIDIDVMFPAQGLSPGAGSMVDLVTARRVGSNLHLEAWKISADPGF